MSHINKKFKYILVLVVFVLLFILIYSQTRYYAMLHFDIKVLDSQSGRLNGQIYFNSNRNFIAGEIKNFTLHHKTYNKLYHFDIPITIKNSKFIRFDPLDYKAEVIISNIYITNNNGKIYIDEKKIDIPNNQHNIELLSNKKGLHLKLIGQDPYFILIKNQTITSNLPPYEYLIKVSIISLFLTIVILFLYKLTKSKIASIESIILSLIILIYSLYSIALPNSSLTNNLIIVLSTLSVIIILKQGFLTFLISYRYFILFLLSIVLLTYISDISNNINRISSFYNKVFYIFLISLITFSFIQRKNFKIFYFKYFLTILTIVMGLFIFFLQIGVVEIERVYLYGYLLSQSNWTQKYYIFWFIFLMWGTISFYKPLKDRKDLFGIIFILLISGLAIFTNYSQSVKLAYIVSVLIYIIFLISRFNLFNKIPIIVSIYFLLSPIILFPFIEISKKSPHLFHGRDKIIEIALKMIYNKPIVGYGFYTTNNLPLKDTLPAELIKDFVNYYNPHSIPLWIWLNFGLIGASIFAVFIYLSLKSIIKRSVNIEQRTSLIALIISFLVITSFSWSGWWNIILLTYAFFVGMILLSLNQYKLKD